MAILIKGETFEYGLGVAKGFVFNFVAPHNLKKVTTAY
jgi:hypothetical protein